MPYDQSMLYIKRARQLNTTSQAEEEGGATPHDATTAT